MGLARDTSLIQLLLSQHFCGLATSLGLGVQQINIGLNYLFHIPNNDVTLVVMILLITAMALISVLTGLHGGY